MRRTIYLILALAAAVTSLRADAQRSAFIQRFCATPVHWQDWGPEAFAKAKAEGKPVFLFVGSFTSELASAMGRQTFANPKVADWLNEHFVCVVVDRDERPDVAALYQSYISSVKQLGGWPLNVFLTPEGLPFEGASYLSPSEDWGAPGFLKLASQAQGAWAADPGACRRHATEARAQLAEDHPPHLKPLDSQAAAARLDAAAQAWKSVYDTQHAGFGDPPRNPEPELLRFLLTRSADAPMAVATLRALARSPVRDPLDGGFFRYANDPSWRIPYPQKTVQDQARIALAYLDAARGPDEAEFLSCATGALGFALSALRNADGTYSASLDGTSEELSGAFTWTAEELGKVLGPQAAAYARQRGVQPRGNVAADDDPSGTYAGRNFLGSPLGATTPTTQDAHLLAARSDRARLARDERATACAHGLLLAAFSEAFARTHEPRFADAARGLIAALHARFVSADGGIVRLPGSALAGGPDDYAGWALGLRSAAAAALAPSARDEADRLLARMETLFYDKDTGRLYACAANASSTLFLRPYAAGDAPGAECLAVLAGSPHSGDIALALVAALEESAPQAPGEQLLELSAAVAPGKLR
jgi:uncharacterized protein